MEGMASATRRHPMSRAKPPADACLIAAAPDLYGALALLRVREHPDCWCPAAHKHGRAIQPSEHTNECVAARAAFAKACGRGNQ